jgi:hypothetical protein
VPPQDRGGSDDQPHRGQAPGRHGPGEQGQPRPVRPRQSRMSPRSLAQGHRELMAQHQDLGVLPPSLPPRQAQHRHSPGHDEEDQLQAHKPKIIPPPEGPGAARPTPERGAGPTAIRRASAQVTRVFGTHTSCRPRWTGGWPSTTPRGRTSPAAAGRRPSGSGSRTGPSSLMTSPRRRHPRQRLRGQQRPAGRPGCRGG